MKLKMKKTHRKVCGEKATSNGLEFLCVPYKKYIFYTHIYIRKDRTLTIWGSSSNSSINIFKIHLIKEERRNSISLELLAFNIVVDDVHFAFRLEGK
jgi:hypothetical protein